MMASACTFRGRLLALADEHEYVRMENIALRKQLGVTTSFDQEGNSSAESITLSVYEVSSEEPLLPSTPECIVHPAMPAFDQHVPAEMEMDSAPSWQGQANIDFVVAGSSISQKTLQELAELPNREAQEDLLKTSEFVHGGSRQELHTDFQIVPATILTTAADRLPVADSEQHPIVRGANDETAVCATRSYLSSSGVRTESANDSAGENSNPLSPGHSRTSEAIGPTAFNRFRKQKRPKSQASLGSNDNEYAGHHDSLLPGFLQKAEPHMQTMFEGATQQALDECYTTTKDCFVLNPLSFRRMIWDAILFSCVLFELWVTPFELFFFSIDALPKTFKHVSNFLTVFFLMDLFINFNTGYIKRGEIVMNRNMVAREYLAGWFWLDLLSSIPFDWLVSQFDASLVRGVKVGKALRLLRAFRYLRVMRAYRRRKQVLNDRKRKKALVFFAVVKPTFPVFCIILMGHFHACMLAAFSNQRLSSVLVGAMHGYYHCFWQAWICLFMGFPIGPKEGNFDFAFIFDVLVSVERACFLAVGGVYAVVFARTRLSDYMQMEAERDSAIKYLKSHAVSLETQLQFQFSLQEMAQARLRQNHFKNLVEHNQLTEELHRRICCELWASHLMSFGLITQIASRSEDSDFIMELCLCVREEVFASKAVLFHYGDAAIAAYCVLTGCLSAVEVRGVGEKTPDYEPGHWIGESALVNPHLRRASSVITKDMSELMAVPAVSFQNLLERLNLTNYFKRFLQDHLWKGICARCGVLGDHFADTCPGIKAHRYTRVEAPNVQRWSMRQSFDAGGTRSWASGSGSALVKMGSNGMVDGPLDGIAADLSRYLKEHKLLHLKDHLKKLGILSLDDLLHMEHATLVEALPKDLELSQQEWKQLSPVQIGRFVNRVSRMVQRHVFDNASQGYYIFLSHSKFESGTEAALMRTELENLIHADRDSTLNDFKVPVFLDSEDLKSLTELSDAVNKTHNLVLLLSPEVLQRVWVLVEIATAHHVGVRVVPVHVSKPGRNFEFPEDEFYEKFRTGETLPPDAKGILETANFTLEEVEIALRSVFREIAVPYSPHMASHMRKAQLECLLKRCRLK